MNGSTIAAGLHGRPRFAEHTCVTALCTRCGARYDDDGECHFGSVAEAVLELATEGWLVSEDEVVCQACAYWPEDSDGLPPETEIAACEHCWPPLLPSETTPAECRCKDRETPRRALLPHVPKSHPGFETTTCVTLRCSGCGAALSSSSGEEIHFSSRDAALSAARGWDWEASEREALCKSCRWRRECLVSGHQWPARPGHVDRGVAYRHCQRCGETSANAVDDEPRHHDE